MRGAKSRLVNRMGRLGVVLLMVGVAACGVDPASSVIDPEPTVTPPAEEPTAEPSVEPTAKPEIDLEEGWTVIDDVQWPVEPGCCGLADIGPTSPEGPIPQHDWPADGVYEVEVWRTADDLTMLHLRLRRWVTCSDLPDDPCAPDPEPDPETGEDRRIVGDPDSEVVRDVPAGELRVVLIPIHEYERQTPRGLDGDPGAFARLLSHGIDPAYHEWVLDPLIDGREGPVLWKDLLERSAEPDFPFGMDYAPDQQHGPMAYRGPFGTSLVADVMWMGAGDPPWPPGHNGLYGWRAVTLEVRDGLPILYLWAGQIAG